jgi:hypothetical protein
MMFWGSWHGFPAPQSPTAAKSLTWCVQCGHVRVALGAERDAAHVRLAVHARQSLHQPMPLGAVEAARDPTAHPSRHPLQVHRDTSYVCLRNVGVEGGRCSVDERISLGWTTSVRPPYPTKHTAVTQAQTTLTGPPSVPEDVTVLERRVQEAVVLVVAARREGAGAARLTRAHPRQHLRLRGEEQRAVLPPLTTRTFSGGSKLRWVRCGTARQKCRI